MGVRGQGGGDRGGGGRGQRGDAKEVEDGVSFITPEQSSCLQHPFCHRPGVIAVNNRQSLTKERYNIA